MLFGRLFDVVVFVGSLGRQNVVAMEVLCINFQFCYYFSDTLSLVQFFQYVKYCITFFSDVEVVISITFFRSLFLKKGFS